MCGAAAGPLLVDAHTHTHKRAGARVKHFFLFASLNFEFFLLFCLLFAQQRRTNVAAAATSAAAASVSAFASAAAAVSFKKFKVASQSGLRSHSQAHAHTLTHTLRHLGDVPRGKKKKRKILREHKQKAVGKGKKKKRILLHRKIKIVCKKE